jgi:hypothetical protein
MQLHMFSYTIKCVSYAKKGSEAELKMRQIDVTSFYSLYHRAIPGLKWPGRGVDHPPPSCAEFKERVELYLYSPLWAFVACSRVNVTTEQYVWPGTCYCDH